MGRRSTRLPPDADQRAISSAGAWEAIVEHAIVQQVHVVAPQGGGPDAVVADHPLGAGLARKPFVERQLQPFLAPVVDISEAEQVRGDFGGRIEALKFTPRVNTGNFKIENIFSGVGCHVATQVHELALTQTLDTLDQLGGARIAARGQLADGLPEGGHYFAPALLADVAPDNHLARDEIFGPVQVVIPFEDEEEAVQIANGTGYGLVAGSLRGRPQLSHGGGIFGFSSHLLYVPEQQLSVVVLQNSNGGADPAQVAVRLAAFALGDPYPEAKPIALAPGTLESYQGVYRIDADSTRELRLVDGILISQRTGGGPFTLMPIAPDTLLFEDSLTYLRIERTDDGAIRGMRMFQNGEGEGQFAALTEEALSTPRQPVSLGNEQLQRVLGTYVGAPGQLTITLEGEQLKAQLGGQPAFDLFAESPQRFFLTVVAAELEFAPAEGAATSVTLYQGGAEIAFQRQP